MANRDRMPGRQQPRRLAPDRQPVGHQEYFLGPETPPEDNKEKVTILPKPPVTDNVWYTQEVIYQNGLVTVKLNDKTMFEYKIPDADVEHKLPTERSGCREALSPCRAIRRCQAISARRASRIYASRSCPTESATRENKVFRRRYLGDLRRSTSGVSRPDPGRARQSGLSFSVSGVFSLRRKLETG